MKIPSNHPLVNKTKPYSVLSWADMKSCKPIDAKSIVSFKHVVVGMVKTCVVEKGVGLCANQVGANWNMFVMQLVGTTSFLGCFNPSYVAAEPEAPMVASVEGCLSSTAPGQKYIVKRHAKILASWQEIKPDGKIETKQNVLLEGLQATVFQHEHDHLSLVDISMKGELVGV